MAYQIDFTASNYVNRSRRKLLLRSLLLATIAGIVWSVHYVYKTYNEPTLNMKLADYENVAHPIEKMNAAWDEAVKEYNSIVHYYRLLWAANPTNFLSAAVSDSSLGLGNNFRPTSWTMKTGGESRLSWRYVFDQGDKAYQVEGLEGRVAHSITSIVNVVDGKLDVSGVQHENLLHVNELNVTAKFSLPNVRAFPTKEAALADCVNKILAMRKKVKEAKLSDAKDIKLGASTASEIMMKYLQTGKDKPDFPKLDNVIDIAGWINRADKFISKYNIPSDPSRAKLKDTWKKVGEARYPWARFRQLDNEELVAYTKSLQSVSDGVKRFKGFLEKRHADCLKKLDPFVESYEHNDIFNKPLVESDLCDRVAKAVGITGARVSFKDETNSEPATLVKDDEKFTFTWVRWTLKLGGEKERNNNEAQGSESNEVQNPLTFEKVVSCVKRALELGPGYALDTIKISFADDGNVASAVIEGLLPVKKIEPKKEKAKNVN